MHNPLPEPIIVASQSLLDGLPVAVLIIDKTGSILYHNDHAESVMPAKRTDSDNITNIFSTFTVAQLSQATDHCDNKPENAFETQLLLDHCHLQSLMQLKMVPYPEVQGLYLITLSSITTESNAGSSGFSDKFSKYATLKKNFKELKQFSRISAMREISSSLADQLNQPLTAILSYTQAMQRLYQSNASPEEIHDAMERVVINAEGAGNIIRDIRARINANSLHCLTISINQLIQESIQLTELDCAASHIRLSTDFDPQGTTLHVDPIQFKQVILSLLHNAIDALSAPDIKVPEINLSTRIDGLRYEIIIADNGPGIPAAVQDKLFEPFFTTKENGIGIGLSMCQHIIDLHKGSITIDSAAPANTTQPGTMVTIHLPRPLSESSKSKINRR